MKSRQYEQGRRQRRLTDEQELELVRMYQHESQITLCNAFGIAKTTVARILSDHGVPIRPRGRPKA